jgi:hypothetical protein
VQDEDKIGKTPALPQLLYIGATKLTRRRKPRRLARESREEFKAVISADALPEKASGKSGLFVGGGALLRRRPSAMPNAMPRERNTERGTMQSAERRGNPHVASRCSATSCRAVCGL